MGIRPRFKRADVRADMQRKLDNLDKGTILALEVLGERCVNIARETDTYRDQTGNLRNSIGYVIVRRGAIIRSNFESTAKPTKTGGVANGLAVGRKLAQDLVADHPTGYALIVVAGMDYAAKVESTGKDVLTSSEQYAEANLPALLKNLQIGIAAVRP